MAEEGTKIQPAEEPAATEVVETDPPKPSKITLPDGSEVTAEQVAEAMKTQEDKANWTRSLQEKGERYNVQLRELADRGTDTQSLKDELAAIKEQIANVPKADTDWKNEEDPDKKTAKFYQSISNTLDRFGGRIEKIETKQSADVTERKDRETMQYWDNVYINACNANQVADNQKANAFISTYVKGKMVEAGGQNWSPDKIQGFAKDAREYIVATGQEAVDKWSKKKVKDKKKPTPSGSGETPAPVAGQKIKGSASLSEQTKIMHNDPNLQ